MTDRKGQRDAAAHGGARHQGAAPADPVEHIRDIVGMLLDRDLPLRLVRSAVAAAIMDQHAGARRQSLGDRMPERSIHGERVDQNDMAAAGRVIIRMIIKRAGETRAVAHACLLFGAWHRDPVGTLPEVMLKASGGGAFCLFTMLATMPAKQN